MTIIKKLFSFSTKEVAFFFSKARVRINSPLYKLYQVPLHAAQTHEHGKLLIITARKCGNACERNLFRRRIKMIYYEHKLYTNNTIIALYAYRKGITCDFQTLQEQLIKDLSPR